MSPKDKKAFYIISLADGGLKLDEFPTEYRRLTFLSYLDDTVCDFVSLTVTCPTLEPSLVGIEVEIPKIGAEAAEQLGELEAAALPMPFWFVTGRVPGDDEDTGWSVGRHPDRDSAIAAFSAELRARDSLTDEDLENIHREHGCFIFINSVVSSDSEIEEA